MTRKSDAKFKEKPTFDFNYDIINLVDFHMTTQTSGKFTSVGSFCPKYIRFKLKIYRGIIFHGTEQWHKIWTKLELVISKMAWGIEWPFIRAIKSLKNCTLMGSVCPKHIIFQRGNFRGMCYHSEEWCKI